MITSIFGTQDLPRSERENQVTDIINRLRGLTSIGPELAMELIATVIDGIGVGVEWSGEQLDSMGELAQQLADKVRGAKEAKGDEA